MTRGLVRYQQTGDFHLLTFSCYHRLPFLSTPESKNLFESAVERTRRRYGCVAAGYVIMPEHVHLLVGEPLIGTLAHAIQALKLSVARRRADGPSGRPATPTSMFTMKKRVSRNSATCTAIPSCADWLPSQKSGPGRASATTRPAMRERSRLNHSGPPPNAVINSLNLSDSSLGRVEDGGFPCLKNETWGTRMTRLGEIEMRVIRRIPVPLNGERA